MELRQQKKKELDNKSYSFKNRRFEEELVKAELFKKNLSECVRGENDFSIFASALSVSESRTTYLFSSPCKIISARNSKEVLAAFAEVENALDDGYYVVGHISYEAACAFDESFRVKTTDFPLLRFTLFKSPLLLEGEYQHLVFLYLMQELSLKPYSVSDITDAVDAAKYSSAISSIKSFIEEGLTYQVNYTFKQKFSFKGEPLSLFRDLLCKQRVPYAAYIKNSGDEILSLSPEMFFRKEGGRISVKPMKGTCDRGVSVEEDIWKKEFLECSEKNRAENLMIVDLLRNDLGVICEKGTVKTQSLFDVEKYDTVYQMTSTIEGVLKEDLKWLDIFKAIFPSGSVTGAPKIMTMNLIEKLEQAPRDVYTGAVGFISPDGSAVFNVAIRTVQIDRNTGEGEMGIGSGITYDSDADDELDECRLKSRFLTDASKSFELIETMRYSRDKGFLFLDEHISRLRSSAGYFDFLFDAEYVQKVLTDLSADFYDGEDLRVRLLINRFGDISIETGVYPRISPAGVRRIRISDVPVDKSDVFLYHKTTNREFYNKALEATRRDGIYDCIFLNKEGFLTEGAVSNVYVKKDGCLFTPPVKDGLLPGVFRGWFLARAGGRIAERSLRREDVLSADRIYLSNSVTGLIPVELSK